MKKILVPIVNRTNYSKLKGVLSLLNDSDDIELSTVLSSGIVVSKTGHGDVDIQADHIPITARIDCLLMSDSLESMCKTVGISIIEHAALLNRENPDVVLVVGDRFDILPVVLSAKMMNIPIFHMQGGELSDSIDNTVRKIISICSDRHYVCTNKALKNVRKLTGSPHIFNFGCSALDYMLKIDVGKCLVTSNFHKKFKDGFHLAPDEDYLLIAVHPVTTHPDDIDMDALLTASLSFGMKCIVVYPNIDAFNDKIVAVIRNYRHLLTCVKHCPFEDFVRLMAHSRCVVGNSSSGIRETASLKVPCLNVGIRQNHRERNDNTIDCKCNFNEVKNAIREALKMSPTGQNVYYKPNACKNITRDILEYFDETKT